MNPSPVEIMQFILDTLSNEEFKTFCFAYFPQVEDNFAPDDARKIRAQKLIQYCQNRGLEDKLLTALQQERPQPYKRRFAQAAAEPVVSTQPAVRNPRQIFISHAHQDSEFAHRLASDLRARGWPVWVAPESIRGGEKWAAAIERALLESGVFLALLTPAAAASKWVKRETDSAMELENEEVIRLIPLYVQTCSVPLLLRSYHRVEFIGNYDAGLSQLVSVLAAPEQEAEVKVMPEAVATAGPLELTIAPGVTIHLVRVPAGEFLMGSADSDKDVDVDEKPQHKVTLDEYLIGKYDVTNAQFRAFVREAGYTTTAEAQGSGWVWDGSKWVDTKGADWQHPQGPRSNINGRDSHPVVQVSRDDAMAFCQWASQAAGGRNVQLPTEAQWEKAARGVDGWLYPWGNTWDAGKANTSESRAGDTTPVGQYSPAGDSPNGAADMAGNVWQWMADWYEATYYTHSPTRNPQGPSSSQYRVLRGGSWGSSRGYARCAIRSGDEPVIRSDYFGFRVVVRLAPVR
jgi:formylglycine-generating enzyme required for sulfatase activity